MHRLQREMAPPKAKLKSTSVELPAKKSYQKILSSAHDSTHQKISRESLSREQSPAAEKIQATVSLDSSLEATQLFQCISECVTEISLRNSLMEIEVDQQPEEEHHQTGAPTEEAAFAAADFQVAFDQQPEEREDDETSKGRGFLNAEVEKKKALLVLRNGFADLRTQIQDARKCLMEG